ncbi:rod shape-determining protein MreC [Sphingomonas koreensis]|nr:rod shape-determining protein MreC [Sphingomonas koreensis]
MAPPGKRRPGFSRRAQYGVFLGYVTAALGAVAGVVLLILSTTNPPAFAPLRNTVAEITAPVSSGLASVGGAIVAVPGAIGDYFGVKHENARLRTAVTRQRALLMRARTLSYDNRRLTRLLALRDRTGGAIVAARLISSSASSTRRFATLNAGWRQGVRTGQPVSGPTGLIGRVLDAGPDTARVLLLGDAESAVPVRRTRDGVPATASGRGDGMLEIRPISLSDAPFKAGDVLMTSGIGGLYPPDIPVARIVTRTRDGALARPFETPDTLDYAIVQQAFFRAPTPPPPTP